MALMNCECKKVLIETVLMPDIIQKTKLSLDHEEEEMLLKHAEETKDFDVNVVLSLDQKVSDQQVCPIAQFFFRWLFFIFSHVLIHQICKENLFHGGGAPS